MPAYATKTPESNTETIFAFKYNKDGDYSDGWYTIGSMYATIQNVGWGEMYASSSYLDLINQNPQDARLKFISPKYSSPAVPVAYWVQKEPTHPVPPPTVINFKRLSSRMEILTSP